MGVRCPECSREFNTGSLLHRHLFCTHGYSNDAVEKIKKESRAGTENIFKCDECDLSYKSKDSLRIHKSRKHSYHFGGNRMQCPLCEEEVMTHEELVEHVQLSHAHDEDEYQIKTRVFTNKEQYEEWRRNEEKKDIVQWATTSVQKSGRRKVSYFRCSRAVPFPRYALTQGRKSKKSTPYCTAFLKVYEDEGAITVTFCDNHCGHTEEPAFLRLDKDSESYILSMLKEGFTTNQILRKLRAECRNQERNNRLYYTTAQDIRNIAKRHNMEPGKKHALDLESVEIRVNDASEEDGIRRYIRATDESGDGFVMVVITPVQKSWLARYSRRGVSLDDTFNLTRYSLRLATVIVADEWDMGLPGAYLLSHRMTENEVFELFDAIKENVPDFDPKLFMTDDTNSFYNGFVWAFPNSGAVKLLCCFHVLQAIKRNCKSKLVEKRRTNMIVDRVRSLCRLSDHGDFANQYASFLTYLQQQKEHQFCHYMEETWSHRVEQWAGFARGNACMNTSMLGERFHKRLKHELPDAKPNMRIDRLLEIIISLTSEMDEDRSIKMQRGLFEGRYRLRQQHRQHEKAVKWFRKKQEDVQVVASGQWKVIEGGAIHNVCQLDCPCDSELNNHCTRGACQACGYGFRCDCEENVLSGISCHHVHASLIYAASGRKTETTNPEGRPVFTSHDIVAPPEKFEPSEHSRVQEKRLSQTDIIDLNNNLAQEINSTYAVIRHNTLKVAKIPDLEVNACLENVLDSMRDIKLQTDDVVKKKCPSQTKQIVRRAELPHSGGVRRHSPIRKLQPRSSQKKKQDTQKEQEKLPSYAQDDVNFCAVCFRRDPKNPTDKENTLWLKCDVCGRWAHEDCCQEGSKCPFDDGSFSCSLGED